MKPPARLKIGTQTWTVAEVKPKHNAAFAEGLYGQTMGKEQTIILDAEMPNDSKRITLFHELLHAIRFVFGGSYTPPPKTSFEEWEHYFIGIYEEPVVMVLRDNPELVAYLLGDDEA